MPNFSEIARKFDRTPVKVEKMNPNHGADGAFASKGGGMGTGGHTGASVRKSMTVHNPTPSGVYHVSHEGQNMGAVAKHPGSGVPSVKGQWISQHKETGASDTHKTQTEALSHLAEVHATHMNKMHAEVGHDAAHKVGDQVTTSGIGAGKGKIVSMHPLQKQWQYQVEKSNGNGGTDTGSHPESSLQSTTKKADFASILKDDQAQPAAIATPNTVDSNHLVVADNALQTPVSYPNILRNKKPGLSKYTGRIVPAPASAAVTA